MNPPIEYVERICEFLGVNIEHFITGKRHIYRSRKKILKNYRILSEKKKEMAEGYIQGLKDQNDEEDNKKEKLSESKIE